MDSAPVAKRQAALASDGIGIDEGGCLLVAGDGERQCEVAAGRHDCPPVDALREVAGSDAEAGEVGELFGTGRRSVPTRRARSANSLWPM